MALARKSGSWGDDIGGEHSKCKGGDFSPKFLVAAFIFQR